MHLEDWSSCLRVLADPTRVRLLALLEREELTVAELASVTRLAQPRVSTHLARLKEARLVHDRRAGVSAYYRFSDDLDGAEAALWRALREGTDDPLLRQDAERLPAVLAMRAADQNWADSVAGDMERHYSPGRTWEAMARATLPLLIPGDVLARDQLCVRGCERTRGRGRARTAQATSQRACASRRHACAEAARGKLRPRVADAGVDLLRSPCVRGG